MLLEALAALVACDLGGLEPRWTDARELAHARAQPSQVARRRVDLPIAREGRPPRLSAVRPPSPRPGLFGRADGSWVSEGGVACPRAVRGACEACTVVDVRVACCAGAVADVRGAATRSKAATSLSHSAGVAKPRTVKM